MADTSFLDWPFLEPRHKQLYQQLERFAGEHLTQLDHDQVDCTCQQLVKTLGQSGLLVHSGVSGEQPLVDVRSLCLIREVLARHDALADFVFAMQGLGSMPISLFGSEQQKNRWLPEVQSGRAICRLRPNRACFRLGRCQYCNER